MGSLFSWKPTLNSPLSGEQINVSRPIQLRLHPHHSLLPTSHVVFSIPSFCGSMSWLNEALAVSVHSKFPCLTVQECWHRPRFAWQAVLLRKPSTGVHLTCCESHSWLVSSPMHSIPWSLGPAHRTLLPQGSTRISPLLGFPSLPFMLPFVVRGLASQVGVPKSL